MCAERRHRRGFRVGLWMLRTLVVLGGAGVMVLLFAAGVLADDTCSPGNPDDCRNTAVVIGTIATLTAVLTISVAGLTEWSREWSPRRCEETIKGLDADIDQGLARARSLMAQRDKYWAQYQQVQDMAIAQNAALLDSQIEELALAVQDLYTRRGAVIQGCTGTNGFDPGRWGRGQPVITRGGGDHIMQIERPQHRPGPVPIDHLTRREGGEAPVDPEAVSRSVEELLKGKKLSEPWKSLVDSLKPKVHHIEFKPTPGGGVRINGTGQLAGMGAGGSVELGVSNGQLTAEVSDLPTMAMPFSGKIDQGLAGSVASFNRDLYERGLEVKSIKVGPDGKLQITTGPR